MGSSLASQRKSLETMLAQWEDAVVHESHDQLNKVYIMEDMNLDSLNDMWIQPDYSLISLSKMHELFQHEQLLSVGEQSDQGPV